MNKSLLLLLAIAIVGTNMVARESCFCNWKHCDGKIAKSRCGYDKKEKKAPRAKKEKKAPRAKKEKKSCCWSCNKKETRKEL